MRESGARARAQKRLLPAERLAVFTPERHLNQALASASGRLASWSERDAAWTALACLAIGDAETARALLRRQAEQQARSGQIAAEPVILATPHVRAGAPTSLYLLVLARYVAWTGDAGFLRAAWPHVRRAYDYCRAEPDPLVHVGALRELAVAAEVVGETAFADELRRDAEQSGHAFAQAPFEPASAALALPILLGAGQVAWATKFLDDVASQGFPLPWAGFVSWAEYATGRSRVAFRHWWQGVEQGAEAADAAMVIAPFVYGLLGAEPDAPRTRLRLRPQVPASWDRLTVERLRVADASLTLRYDRAGACHRFRVAQETGAVPLRLVLEAALPGRRLARARVDGRSAELDARAFGERLLVPLQLVVDHERTVELVTDRSLDAPAD